MGDLVGGCDFYGPVPHAESHRCHAAAEGRTVHDDDGEPVQVALCDKHYGYVSDKEHAHYWYVDRGAGRSRALIRMVRQHG